MNIIELINKDNEPINANDIVNTIDPDKWKCCNCHKWNTEEYFIIIKLSYEMKLCSKCWKDKFINNKDLYSTTSNVIVPDPKANEYNK